MEPKMIEAGFETPSVKTVVAPGTTYQMTKRDLVVETSTTSGNNVVLKLPPVAEAAGRIYSIFCTSYSTGTLTISTADSYINDNDTTQSLTMDATDEYLVIFCDGFRWFSLATNIS